MPAQPKTGRLCEKHGGPFDFYDAWWSCDACATAGCNKCKCGGNARVFGEALFSTVGCEECEEEVHGVDINARELWNAGVRGAIPEDLYGRSTQEILDALFVRQFPLDMSKPCPVCSNYRVIKQSASISVIHAGKQSLHQVHFNECSNCGFVFGKVPHFSRVAAMTYHITFMHKATEPNPMPKIEIIDGEKRPPLLGIESGKELEHLDEVVQKYVEDALSYLAGYRYDLTKAFTYLNAVVYERLFADRSISYFSHRMEDSCWILKLTATAYPEAPRSVTIRFTR